MKTRWLLSGLVLGSLLALEGCGAGQYKIPNVEPVVKQKPQDDLLENIEGNTPSSSSSSSSTGSTDTAAPPSGGTDDSSSDSSKSDSGAKSKK